MVNKVILVGRLGQDPESRFTQNSTQVSNFSIATSKKYKNQSGQDVEKTEWHKIVTWQKLAEICNQYLKKGSLVYIEGKIQTRKWQDKDGQDRYQTEIVASVMKMLNYVDSENNNNNNNNNNNQNSKQNNDTRVEFTGDDDIPF